MPIIQLLINVVLKVLNIHSLVNNINLFLCLKHIKCRDIISQHDLSDHQDSDERLLLWGGSAVYQRISIKGSDFLVNVRPKRSYLDYHHDWMSFKKLTIKLPIHQKHSFQSWLNYKMGRLHLLLNESTSSNSGLHIFSGQLYRRWINICISIR